MLNPRFFKDLPDPDDTEAYQNLTKSNLKKHLTFILQNSSKEFPRILKIMSTKARKFSDPDEFENVRKILALFDTLIGHKTANVIHQNMIANLAPGVIVNKTRNLSKTHEGLSLFALERDVENLSKSQHQYPVMYKRDLIKDLRWVEKNGKIAEKDYADTEDMEESVPRIRLKMQEDL